MVTPLFLGGVHALHGQLSAKGHESRKAHGLETPTPNCSKGLREIKKLTGKSQSVLEVSWIADKKDCWLKRMPKGMHSPGGPRFIGTQRLGLPALVIKRRGFPTIMVGFATLSETQRSAY